MRQNKHPFVKDAVERIVKNGNSSLLLQLAERVGNAAPSKATTESMNVVAMPTLRDEEVPVQRDEWRSVESNAQKSVVISSKSDWDHINKRVVEMIIVNSNCCNEEAFNILDFSDCQHLRELSIGNDCFENVKVVRFVGMDELESVMIGDNSFTKIKDIEGANVQPDPIRHFYLKSCPKMKSLNIGHYSFLDYSICEIESVDALETIQIGEVGKDSMNFMFCCAFQLRSCFSLNLMICRYVISQDCYHWTRIDARALLRCL